MMRLSTFCLSAAAAFLATPSAQADDRVRVNASANPEYTERKFGGGGPPKVETYVFMEGHFYPGTTVDRSIERMPFRRIAEYLAPQLAKQKYLPAPDLQSADLVLVVHRGTTTPHVSIQEMMGDTRGYENTRSELERRGFVTETAPVDTAPPEGGDLLPPTDPAREKFFFENLERVTEAVSNDMTQADNARLLGYNSELHRLARDNPMGSPTETTLRHDLLGERYFIIICAYDLRAFNAGTRRKPVWKMHLNVSSPGNNFRTAMDRMGVAAVNFFGRTSDGIPTVRTKGQQGTVKIGDLIILNDQVSPAK
jgi:hypothetical protein